MQLTDLEVASGVVWGERDDGFVVPDASATSPRAALDAALRPLLEPGPCFITFSGGQDSSALLAAATALARRESLGLPVPITYDFTGVPRADEHEWQEHVVAELGLSDWVRTEVELDLLGPWVTDRLRRFGLQWPPQGYAFDPLLEHVRGGALVVGVGGDELLLEWPTRRLWHRPPRHSPVGWAARALLDAAPRRLRAAAHARHTRDDLPWVTPVARGVVLRAVTHERVSRPRTWRRQVRWVARRRRLQLLMESIRSTAEPAGVVVAAPLLDPGVIAAIAAARPVRGFATRGEAFRLLTGGALPDRTRRRTTKAEFSAVHWGPAARAFARDWDGTGLEHLPVDPEALRRQWLADRPIAPSSMPLHAAWLASTHADMRAPGPSGSVRPHEP